jgi:ligand-binding SRPBCC domain-containing protein
MTYVHSNAEVIGMMIEHHAIKVAWRDTFRFKLNRDDRIMIDEVTGKVYEIPESVVLT